ncbi:MAG TPA: ATPase, partial [Dietzia sp.]|nr:ATPase [Dietzia sp.]
YVDPRQLEKFWGPPTWPATFTRHDVFPGGRSDYYMTGPDGSRACGYWEYLSVDECRSFEVLDGFSHDDGRPNTDLPTREAMGQIEAVVTDEATFAADTGTQSQLLDERTVRVTRILHGTP